jgi:hypothetical protein
LKLRLTAGILALFLAPAAVSAAVAPANPPVPRLAPPERPPGRILPYAGAPSVVPVPRVVQTCPPQFGGLATGLGQPSGATYGSAYGESLSAAGPGSINAQASAVLGTQCPQTFIGSEPVPGTLDLSGAPHAATPYRIP